MHTHTITEKTKTIYPIFYSYARGITSVLIQSAPKPYAAFPPPQFDQDWPTGFRDIQIWKCGRWRTDDRPLVYYKLTLWAFSSGELKKKNGKRRQKLITESWFSFPQYTCPLSRCIQNLKTLAVIRAENSVMKSFNGEKEKWTNKGNNRQQHADSLLNNTTSHTQHLYQISKS